MRHTKRTPTKRVRRITVKTTSAVAQKVNGKKRTSPRPGRKSRRGEDAKMLVRRVEALQLRVGGFGYRAIATKLKVAVSMAYTDIERSLHELNAIEAERTDVLRTMENERLDRYLQALQPAIEGCDGAEKFRAIGLAIDVCARRCKMMGLDAERTGPSGEDFLQMTHQMVAIIQEHVHDQRILDAIADQFEATLEQHHAPGLTLVTTPPSDHS